MKSIYKQYPGAFLLAVVLHLVMGGMLVLSFDWTAKTPETPPPQVNVVKATAVDEKQVQAELDKIKKEEAKKRKKEEDRVKTLEKKADQARKQREKEQQRLTKLEEKRKIEQARKKQAEQERKMLEADRQKAEEAARKAKEEVQHALEIQRRMEEQTAREKMMAEEAKRLNSERARKQLADVQKYTALIKEKIESRWVIPSSAKVGVSCTVQLRIMPTGNVISVNISRSSGDKIFDRSVEIAVQKASPLPLPNDASLYGHFREAEFTFKKES